MFEGRPDKIHIAYYEDVPSHGSPESARQTHIASDT
jgi:hypothetical protein